MLTRKAKGDWRLLDPEKSADPPDRVDWEQCVVLPDGQPVNDAPPAENEAEPPAQGPMVRNIMEAAAALLKRLQIDKDVPLYIADGEGRLVYWSEGYERLAAGIDGASSLRAPREGASPALTRIIREVQDLGRGITLQEKLRVHGVMRHLRSRHFPIRDERDRIIAVAGTYADCTAEIEALARATEAQARFHDFARASSDCFWETDRDGRITMLSDRITALLGIPARRLVGRRLDEVGVFKAAGEDFFPALDAMRHHRPFRGQFLELAAVDGSKVTLNLSGVPIFDPEDGSFLGYRGAGMDVTNRMAAERLNAEVQKNLEHTLEELTQKNMQLDLASAEAAQALRVKNEFLAAMSHELRTPLNAIIGFAEAMKMELFGKLNDHYKSYSSDILQAGRHLLGLINDVLDVAILESDRIVLEPEAVSLREIINGALSFVVMRADKKMLDTSAVRIASDRVVYVDARRLTQIFVNLFSNAVKFTPEGGRIGVDISDCDDGGMVAVTVWDTGIGIPEDKQELVFEKFQQCVDNIYSRREEGTGLGLHISRQLARLMGGEITLESRVGEGSRFTVTLPLYLDRKDPPEP